MPPVLPSRCRAPLRNECILRPIALGFGQGNSALPERVDGVV